MLAVRLFPFTNYLFYKVPYIEHGHGPVQHIISYAVFVTLACVHACVRLMCVRMFAREHLYALLHVYESACLRLGFPSTSTVYELLVLQVP